MDGDGLAGDVSRGESPSFSTPSCVRALFQGLGCGRRRAGHALVLVCSFRARASLVAGEHQEGHWRECERARPSAEAPGLLLLPETTQPVSQGWGWTRHRDAPDPSAGMRERAASVAQPGPGHLLPGGRGLGPPPGQRWVSEAQASEEQPGV